MVDQIEPLGDDDIFNVRVNTQPYLAPYSQAYLMENVDSNYLSFVTIINEMDTEKHFPGSTKPELMEAIKKIIPLDFKHLSFDDLEILKEKSDFWYLQWRDRWASLVVLPDEPEEFPT
jgi:hypothetical protein